MSKRIVLARTRATSPKVTTEPSLSERMHEQASEFGTEFVKDDVVSVDFSGDLKFVNGKNGIKPLSSCDKTSYIKFILKKYFI
jgi:thioredoxin reductase